MKRITIWASPWPLAAICPRQSIIFSKRCGSTPGIVSARLNLAIALAQSNRPQEAIEQYQQALLDDPDDPKVHYNFGNVLLNVGKPQDAIEHFEQAVRLNPDYIQAYMNLARTYAQTNRSDDAIITATHALELANSTGNEALAKKIEDWLTQFRAGQTDP